MLTPRIKKYLLLFGILSPLVLFMTVGRLLEATFSLAKESRLPKWVTLPAGLTRADVSFTLSYYTTLWGGSARFQLLKPNQQTIESGNGRVRCGGSFQMNSPQKGYQAGYPEYEAVTVKGITEIFEQRKPEPFLYVTDDPAVWKQYHAMDCW
jgi:hypothetical protein